MSSNPQCLMTLLACACHSHRFLCHRFGDFFPGTGDIKDVGARAGKRTAPVSSAVSSAMWHVVCHVACCMPCGMWYAMWHVVCHVACRLPSGMSYAPGAWLGWVPSVAWPVVRITWAEPKTTERRDAAVIAHRCSLGRCRQVPRGQRATPRRDRRRNLFQDIRAHHARGTPHATSRNLQRVTAASNVPGVSDAVCRTPYGSQVAV